MVWKALVIGSIFFASTTDVMAQGIGKPLSSGNAFYAECSKARDDAGSDPINFGLCYGYIKGIIDRDLVSGAGRRICLPDSVTNGQMMDVVLLYLRNNPADRHIAPLLHISLSLRAAFPCKTEK